MELIKVKKRTIGENEVNAVDARELHKFLEIKKQFKEWIEPKIEEYDFAINTDFYTSKYTSQNGRKMETYIISMDMAKEISMISKTKQGKKARKYFIECEKKLKEIAQAVPFVQMPNWEIEGNAVKRFLIEMKAPTHLIPVEMTKHVHLIGGPDLRHIPGQLSVSQNISDESVMLEPTELGREFKLSATNMNKKLEELDLQVKKGKKWMPTDKGAQICSRHLWSSAGKSGYNYKWNLGKVVELMEEINYFQK